MNTTGHPQNGVNIFVSYSHKDEQLWEQLREHLAPLEREGKIAAWHDRKLQAGGEFDAEIDAQLARAEVVLILVSASFIASNYCFDVELARALEQHEAGATRVVPIVLRPCEWKRTPFAKLLALPKDGKAVVEWSSIDNGFLSVAEGLRSLVDEVIKKRVEKQRPVRTDLVSISTLLSEDMNRLDEQTKNPNMTTGVSTGFVDLDSLVDGLHRGSVVVVGARPAMPKGSFVTNIACHVATNLGLPTVFFCPRTKATDITRKMTAQIANVEQARLLRAHLEASDWDRLSAAITRIHTAPLFVDDSPTLTVSDIREKCKHLKQQTGGIVLVVVDHLQALINPSIKDHASTIARELRALARELDVPILVTLAVSRVVDARPNRRPVERDLGEWSAFEDEADVLIFVYRDEAYNPESPDQGTVEIIVARNSYGQIATVRLNYDERVDAFSDFDGWGGGT